VTGGGAAATARRITVAPVDPKTRTRILTACLLLLLAVVIVVQVVR
jgi:hypothetical protein